MMVPSGEMQLDFLAFTLKLRARRELRFENWNAGNLFRGVFGISLKNHAPHAYARLFEPVSEGGPSGLKNQPRHFVIQAGELNGLTVPPDAEFTLRVNIFDHPDVASAVVEGFRHMDMAQLWDAAWETKIVEVLPQVCNKLTIDFLSPMELKWHDRVLREPHFPALVCRARDRVATLSGPGLDWDFKRLGDLAETIRMIQCDIQNVAVERTSSRTGQHHGIGGFIGTATYEGELDELLPVLEAAQYTGIGRHTAWGNGMIGVRID